MQIWAILFYQKLNKNQVKKESVACFDASNSETRNFAHFEKVVSRIR